MENQRINLDGMNLAYTRRGKGRPLILIHGYPLDRSIWDEVTPRLAGEFDVICPDLRGFGGSDMKDAAVSIGDYASDLAGLLSRLDLEKAYIAGHSMGGYVALAFVRAYRDRVSGLALVSSQMAADTPERKEGRYATARQVVEHGVGPVADSMAPKLSAEPRLQALSRELIGRQRPAGVSGALRAMAERPDSSDIFPGFTFPVVIIHGDADALIPVERGRDMKAVHGAAHYVELRGAGHLPMLEQPAEVAEALRFFQGTKTQ